MEIVKYPTKSLLEKSIEVVINDDLRDFANEMIGFMKTLKWGKVNGLAAPQVGRNIRLFYAEGDWFVNPIVLWKPKEGIKPCHEGCFSLEEGKFDYQVDRAYAIKIKFQDLNGNNYEKRFNGFKAQVIQHELDHLEGILCCGN